LLSAGYWWHHIGLTIANEKLIPAVYSNPSIYLSIRYCTWPNIWYCDLKSIHFLAWKHSLIIVKQIQSYVTNYFTQKSCLFSWFPMKSEEIYAFKSLFIYEIFALTGIEWNESSGNGTRFISFKRRSIKLIRKISMRI